MTRPRLLIADDHRIFAEGLRGLLEHDYEIAGIVEDGTALLAAVKEHAPDLVVADVSMPGISGIDCVRRLREPGHEAPVVLLTMHAELEFATAAVEAGAAGYVLKAGCLDELRLAIDEALRGGVYISASLAREVFAAMATQRESTGGLTPRQQDVLSGLARGLTAKEIAAELHLSPRTVESYKYQLMDKLGLKTSAELIKYALQHGLGA